MFPAEFLSCALCAGFVEVEDGDASAVLGESLCGGEADPAGAGGARDDCSFAGEQHWLPPDFYRRPFCSTGLAATNEKSTPNAGGPFTCPAGSVADDGGAAGL
jgi:hypothetical protein